MEELSLCFNGETMCTSASFSILYGHSWQSETLVECSQPCRTIHIILRCGNVCGFSMMNAGAFSSVLFQVVLLLPGEGENVSEKHWTVE